MIIEKKKCNENNEMIEKSPKIMELKMIFVEENMNQRSYNLGAELYSSRMIR